MRRKGLITLALTVGLALEGSFGSFAGQWMQDATGWWWQKDDGSYPKDSWEWLDGNKDGIYESYHFNADGYLDVNTEFSVSEGKSLIVDENGAARRNDSTLLETRRNGPSPDKQTRFMFEGVGSEHDAYLTIHDNSEYMSEYSDLQPGVAFIYSLPGELPFMIPLYALSIELDYSLIFEYNGYYYKTIKETDNYKEMNLYTNEDDSSLCGKFCVYTDDNGGYVRAFGYY